jgi:hypothetical protein
MAGAPRDETGDAGLGMGERICRRDFLNAAALATGSAFLSPLKLLAARDDWTGYGGVGDYRFSNGNTKDVMDAAHAIRDRSFPTLPRDTADTGELFDLVVVGGGPHRARRRAPLRAPGPSRPDVPRPRRPTRSSAARRRATSSSSTASG